MLSLVLLPLILVAADPVTPTAEVTSAAPAEAEVATTPTVADPVASPTASGLPTSGAALPVVATPAAPSPPAPPPAATMPWFTVGAVRVAPRLNFRVRGEVVGDRTLNDATPATLITHRFRLGEYPKRRRGWSSTTATPPSGSRTVHNRAPTTPAAQPASDTPTLQWLRWQWHQPRRPRSRRRIRRRCNGFDGSGLHRQSPRLGPRPNGGSELVPRNARGPGGVGDVHDAPGVE